MAATSLWHIEGRLKDLISYVENPEKTVPNKEMQDLLYISRWATARKKEHKNPPNLKTNSEGNLGYNKITHPNIVFGMLPSYRTMKYKSPIWGYFHVQKE